MQSEVINRTTALAVLFALQIVLGARLHGAVISSREDLNSQLGAAAVTENFESYLFPAGTAERVGTVLDASSVLGGQGPGLVREGIRFIEGHPAGDGLQWDRQTGSGAMVTDGQLILDFTIPTTHVGFDMFWFFALNYPATIQVFGADDLSLKHSVDIFDPAWPNSTFFGYADNAGIGRVVLFRDEGGELGVSPIIDNLTFGYAPVPEPGAISLGLLGLGGLLMLRWRRTAAEKARCA